MRDKYEMHWSIGTKIGINFAVVMAAVVVVGTISHQSTTQLVESGKWVAHTHQVLSEIEGLLSALKDAEVGQRGYLVTGDETYLEPYLSSRASIDQCLRDVRQLTSDNPVQQSR